MSSSDVGKASAGNYSEYPQLKTLSECVQGCCHNRSECNVAFVYNESCFHIKCVSDELCYPVKQPENATTTTRLVVVSSVDEQQVVMDPLPVTPPDLNSRTKALKEALWKNAKSTEDLMASTFADRSAVQWTNGYAEDYPASRAVPETNEMPFKECEIGLGLCGAYEACYQVLPKSRQGICTCIYGYTRNEENDCVPRFSSELIDMPASLLSPRVQAIPAQLQLQQPQQQSITVSVASKDVRLPEKEAVLSAYTIPDEQTSGDVYEYAWSLISQPNSSNGTISDQTKDRILLSNLSEGVYRFRVRVTGAHGQGEAEANLTVLAEQRALRPPQVTINPQVQTLRLPNSQAILDGSCEGSDAEVVSWHWTLSSGPIGYKPELPETNMLQLTDLRVPGNYTFQLTVTDANGGQNSSTAEVYVLKGTDYPPEANAVPNVMVRLPQNSLVLNGSQSTDDRGIVGWEWTKDLGDSSSTGAVDMQDTRTPFLKLSNLEEGTYRFVLKVTDGSGQSSNTSVMVFVKPPLTTTPMANAGQDQEITLPVNSVLLNGTQSCDTTCGQVKYEWVQRSGPSEAEIGDENAAMANASKLTVGEYVFQLTVTTDEDDLLASKDEVKVTVVHVVNTAPVANAGGDQSVAMPVPLLTLNGTRSSDDLRIVSYAWSRERSSLAAGDVVSVPGSPVLSLANVVPGRYVFKLTVTDDQGLTGEDVARVIVHADPDLLNLVDLTVAIEYATLTQSELELLLQKISLFLGDHRQVDVRSFKAVARTADSTLRFGVVDTQTRAVLSGVEVEREFKRNLARDAEIFGVEVLDIRTVVCQNNCSSRGRCDEETRQCICNSFWAVDLFSQWQMGGESNCGGWLVEEKMELYMSKLGINN